MAHLAERGEELAVAESLLERACAGDGALLLIEGPPGIGKSSILDALVPGPGVRALRSRASELERVSGFGVVRQLFERPLARDEALCRTALAGAAAIAASVVLPPGEVAITADAALHGLTWLASNLADERPLLLVVDDLQWADPGSLAWIEHLARRVADLPLLVACGWRTGEPDTDEDALDRLRDEPGTRVIRPAPLSDAAVTAVVRDKLPDAAEALCQACARSSGGNPFLLVELVRSLAVAGGQGPLEVAAVRPESVGRSVGRRLGRLDEHARQAIHAAAVLGDGAELRHVAALAGLTTGEAAAACDALSAAQILAPGRPLRFVHPLVRSALYDRLPGHGRGEAHVRAARILHAEGAEAGRVSAHLLAAPPRADPWAARQLHTAGRELAARGAPAEAMTVLRRALAEPVAPGRERLELLLALAEVETQRLEPIAVERLVEVASQTEEPVLAARGAVALVVAGLLRGGEELFGVVERARAGVQALDRDLWLELTAGMFGLRFMLDPAAEATLGARQALPAPETLPGRTRGEKLLLAAMAYQAATWGGGTAAEAAALARRALGEWSPADGIAPPVVQAMFVLLVTDEIALATRLIRDGLRAAERSGAEVAHAIWLVLRCYQRQLAGDLAGAEADGSGLVERLPMFGQMRATASAYLGRTLIDRGALDEADRILQPFTSPALEAAIMAQTVGRVSLVQLRIAQGRFAEAVAVGDAIARRQAAAGAENAAIPWRIDVAHALAAVGDRARARRLIAEQQPLTRHWDHPRQAVQLLRVQGLVEGGAEGIDLLRASAELAATTPARLEQARSLLALGAALRRANQRVEAREQLRAALDLADRCAARRLVDEARGELAASGAQLRRVRTSGVDALTPSELRVARLAAEGLNNPEIAQRLFVTRKTVETHLGATYRKLDISSRDELADLVGIQAA